MPGGDKNIGPQDGKRFSSEYQPLNRGQKPKVFSEISKEYKSRGIEKATPDAIKEAFEYLLALPLAEVKRLSIEKGTDGKIEDDYPSVIRIVASEMLDKKKRSRMINDMLNRAHGTPKQSIDLKGDVKSDVTHFYIPSTDKSHRKKSK